MLTTIVILSVVGLLSIVSNIFLIKSVKIQLAKISVYEEWIIRFRSQILETYSNLKLVDEKNIFEKDDDVGFVFSNIVEIVEDLKNKVYDQDSTET